MQNGKDPHTGKVIDLASQRAQIQHRRRAGAHAKAKSSPSDTTSKRPQWLNYLQFFALLGIVAWLMRQCS